MDQEGIMLSKIIQTEKDKYHIIHWNVESKKQNKLTNETKQKRTHRYWKQMAGCQRGGIGEKWEWGINF